MDTDGTENVKGAVAVVVVEGVENPKAGAVAVGTDAVVVVAGVDNENAGSV